jgi:cytochrome c oxidase assembly protein subunit 15
MTTHEKRIHTLFDYWLTSSLVLVFLTIIIGGLTRLTNSGLSITEWELFSGILPPLNNASWEKYFDLYKQIPQFKLINPNMLLSEFKIIFYWEYFHRILARLIGLFFLIPFIYFYFCNNIFFNNIARFSWLVHG